MRELNPDLTPLDAFEARITRRLEEMRHALAVELNRVHGEVVKLNAQTNDRNIFMKLPVVEACADAATEFVLTEAKTLTDPHQAHAWNVWLAETGERARSVLTAHVEAIFESNWRIAPEFMHTVRANVDDARARALAKVSGEVGDFVRGVWRPKAQPAPGGTIITTNNTVNVGGDMSGGSVDQAGHHVVKEAGASAGVPMVTFYVARASNNPVANGAFLAAQALIHPGRSLYLEEVSPGRDGEPPVLRVRLQEEPAGPDPAKGVVAGQKPPAAPVLTPTFNWAFAAVVGLVLIGLCIESYAGFLYGGPVTDATKGVLSAADWIVKGGVGAIIGLIGGKVAK